MAIDHLMHIPYLIVIGFLLITVISLFTYLLCCKTKTREAAVQTYYTCLPKQLSAAEKESHGLQKMDLEKGNRFVEVKPNQYTLDTASQASTLGPPATASSVGDHTSLTHGPTRAAPAPPNQAVHSYKAPVPPAPDDEHDYINAHAWTNTSPNDNSNYRASHIQPIDTQRNFSDDDVISAAFTNDSFETYDDQYINTADLSDIHRQING